MWQSLPDLGTGVLYAILVTAAYTFAVSLAAGRGRPRLLESARQGAYATSALIAFGVVLLAYAFITHDFRIKYVAHYSDRSMSTAYLLTALWGGQDGSLLWWSTLLALNVVGVVRWMKGRYRQLQPYVIATLMVIVAFFGILMIFAANPFATSVAGARADGEGLNPLLQNYWMIIHPPALYTGFVGCSVPFAFAVAALVTGRLDNEWIIAVRKWMLFAFVFLSIGNALGMIWAYEELGWGGYWAWDPVENAAVLPWFTAAAYVHSTMIQERRNMLKIWNVFLICLTFFLTIFGTFLTRSGMISSVHSFAQSNIGIFFVGFMGLVLAACAGLIVWRLPQLTGKAHIEAVASREAMFVVNNWALLGLMTFVLVATMFPKISEWLWNEKVTVGPPFFNRWAAPIGLVVFALMGMAPLFGWRKTSGVSLKRAFAWPVGVMLVGVVLHFVFGKRLGFPPVVEQDAFYPGLIGTILQKLQSTAPVVTIALVGFNLAVIAQEFVRGVQARQSAAKKRDSDEGVLLSLVRLVDKNRRRYGGYIVHLGIVSAFVGFVGSAWIIEQEVSLVPGQTTEIGSYSLTYQGTRMCPGNPGCSPEENADVSKRMIFADLNVSRSGKAIGRLSPAKFIYKAMPDNPTTEVALRRGLKDDLYIVLGSANPETKKASFRIHVNPLVSWIWIGLVVLMGGCTISLWPEYQRREVGAWAYVRTAAGVASGVMLGVLLASTPGTAQARTLAPRAEQPVVQSQAWGHDLPQGRLGATGLALVAGVAVGLTVSRRRRALRRD